MNKVQFAEMLNGREYRHEITKEECRLAEKHGLVVAFGASDDLMEFRGAIHDEFDCYNGGTAYLDKDGLFENVCGEDCPYVEKEMKRCNTIRAVWDIIGNPCWAYETEIPHATFNIHADDELYCVGIVFEMAAI